MYVRKEIAPNIIWFFSWKALCVFTLLSVVAVLLYSVFNIKSIAMPFLPVATIGTAVAFYVGFKNNASYERLWEARKIWSEIEHLCRYSSMLILKNRHKGQSASALTKKFVYTQIAWTNCLRLQLRYNPTFRDEDATVMKRAHRIVGDLSTMKSLEDELHQVLSAYMLDADLTELKTKRNIATELIFYQLATLDGLKKDGLCDSDYENLLATMGSCSQQQAASERINSFPFPRQYAHFSTLFVNIFIILLPFSLLGELKTDPSMTWLVVPFSVLISWVFYTMESVAETSENPFENALNDVPLTTICREIEIDLKAMLGERDLPGVIAPKEFILL